MGPHTTRRGASANETREEEGTMETLSLESDTAVVHHDSDIPHLSDSPVPQYVSFGMYLSRAREAKGLSLDDLAHLTKIRRSIIEALEHNAKRDLPEKVFVLGYVRSYATAVGLSVEDAVARCSASWDEQTAEIGQLEEKARKKTRSWAWIWPTLATLAGGGAIWFIIRLQ
jgi:transcriptional regulator with XRE-family HTH domain